MQQGSRYNKDQDATRIKMQRGSRCNEDQDAMRIKMHFKPFSVCSTFLIFFKEMKNNEEESFLSYQLNAEFT